MEIDPSFGTPEDMSSFQESGPSVPIPMPVPSLPMPIPQPGALPAELFQPAPEMPDFSSSPPKDAVRELCVKVHIRRSGKDAWAYLGRAFVTQEFVGNNSTRVVVRSAASGKLMVVFSEESDLQAEKRGNFVIVSCLEAGGVISWSLNTMNNGETLKLLTCIELACYRCRQQLSDPKNYSKMRRKIERTIKDDRRRRHRRRRDEESMVEAFGKQQIN